MRKLLGLLVGLMLLCACMTPAYADPGEVQLSWDASVGATGYKVYLGAASGVYGDPPADVGNVTTVQVASMLDGCVQQFLAVTAYNGSGESAFSDEVATFPRPNVLGDPVASGENLLFSGGNFAPGMTVTVDGAVIPFTRDSCVLFTVPVINIPTAVQGVSVPFEICNGTVCTSYLLVPISAPLNPTVS